MVESPREPIPWKTQIAIYGVALFNFSMVGISSLIVALLLVRLTDSKALIGIVIGSRHFLTLLLSIHGGVLMDRFGTRRVMIIFGVIAMIAPLLFPITPWIAALTALQMIAGLADAMGWMGAQSLSGTVMKGDPVYVGRMTFLIRIGSFIGPIAIGFVWDIGGMWPAFAAMCLWSGLGFLSTLNIPDSGPEQQDSSRTKVRPRDLVPRFADYISAFSLAVIPAIALALLITVVRVAGTGIQTSFYVVYLENIDFSASMIGLLTGVSGLVASIGSLSAGPLARLIHPHWLMVHSVALSVVTIAVTPLLGGVYAILMFAICLRGLSLGISQPVEISAIARALPAGSQGQGVGLRTTVNRFASFFMPIVMGAVAEFVGVEASFYVMGGLLLSVVVVAALYTHRNYRLGKPGEGRY